MPKKIQFQVVYSSSADDNHHGRELEVGEFTATQSYNQGMAVLKVLSLSPRIGVVIKGTHESSQTATAFTSVLDFEQGGSVDKSSSIWSISLSVKLQVQKIGNRHYVLFLSYVGLSSNENTGFKARELKSIHLDAEGHFVKLILHKNHVNKYNLYNQVGLVAVNVIGDPLDTPYDPLDPDPLKNVDSLVQGYMNPTAAHLNNGPVWGRINKPDYISRMDDLAFDMYQDPETAALIRKLDEKKKEAIQQERYDYAKRLTAVISDLYKVGEKLGRYEVEKKRAAEQENFDLAMEKKRQSDEFRVYVYKQLDIRELLELNGHQPHEHRPINITPPPLPPIPSEQSRQQAPPPPRQEEDKSSPPPLAPIKHQFSPRESTSPPPPAVFSPRLEDAADERPIPALNKRSPEADLDSEDAGKDTGTADTGGPEPMKERDIREASFVIEVFGQDLVQHAYSKQWKYRQEAMETLEKELTSPTPNLTADKDPKTVVTAALVLIQKGIKEQVFSVFSGCLEVLRLMIQNYLPQHKIVKSEMSHVVEKATPPLLTKSGEMAARSRDAAVAMLLEMAVHKDIKGRQVLCSGGEDQEVEVVLKYVDRDKSLMSGTHCSSLLVFSLDSTLETSFECSLYIDEAEELKRKRCLLSDAIVQISEGRPLGVIPDQATKPFKMKQQVPARMYKSRIEIIEKLLGALELDTDKPGSLSTANIMRVITPALEHTSGDVRDPASRVVLKLYKKVKDTVREYLPSDEPATRKNPLYRNLFDGFDRIDGKPTEAERKAQAKVAQQNTEKAKQAEIAALQAQLQALRDMAGESQKTSNPKQAKADEPVDVDRMCIFCGEQNNTFTEEGLDLHYWKSCPMLKRCDHCSQVIEIAGVSDHLLTECESSDKFSQCPRCKEAIHEVDFDGHIAQKTCQPAKGNKPNPRCVLCKKRLGQGDEVWGKHLKEECAPNKARLQQQLATTSKAPSQVSLRSNRGRGGKATPLARGAGKGRGRKGGPLPR